MNTSRKGARREHMTIAYLEARGYRCTRSAASLGLWDVVAISPADVLLVQVKTARWPGAVELAELEAFAAPPGVQKVVHRWRRGRPLPDVRYLGAAGGLDGPA